MHTTDESQQPRRLISSDEAVTSDHQHTQPCSDCPFARTALNGWLGGVSIEEWLQRAHSDTVVACHTISNQQCAGLAIYRRNVAKGCWPPMLKLPADRKKAFATPMEFRAHHEAPLIPPKKRKHGRKETRGA